MAIKNKRGWKKATQEIIGECGLDCENATMPDHSGISVEIKERKGTAYYGVPLCDEHRRMLCTCDLCVSYKADKHPVADDVEDEEYSPEPEEFWDGYCQIEHGAEDTDGSDWCGDWSQSRPITIKEVESRIEKHLAKAEEEEDEEEDDEEDEEDEPVPWREARQRLGLGEMDGEEQALEEAEADRDVGETDKEPSSKEEEPA